MSLGSWESGFGLDLETLTGYFRVRAIFGLYGCLRPPKMFSVGPILGFRPVCGMSMLSVRTYGACMLCVRVVCVFGLVVVACVGMRVYVRA